MHRLTWDQVRARRLARNHLLDPAPADQLVDVVGAVCGVQAQMMGAAELAIGARVTGVVQQDVRDELWRRRALVKTYGPRGTLHLLPARELPMWMAALRAIPNHQGSMWYELADLTRHQIDELVTATADALDGRRLTRDELAREVSGRVGRWARDRLSSTWGDLLAPAALSGALCFGPSEGAKVTFVRADQWISGWREEEPRPALLGLLRRFLAAYGPSTPQEFGRWFATKPATARELFGEVDKLVEVDVEGWRGWMLAADLDQRSEPPGQTVRLLPQYDCLVIGSRPREQLLRDEVNTRVRSYRRGRFEGVVALSPIVVDGLVRGIWERRRRGRRVEIAAETIGEFNPHQRELLEAEAARIGAFLGADASLSVRGLG